MKETISNEYLQVEVYAGKTGFNIISLKDLTHNKEWIYCNKPKVQDHDCNQTYDEQYFGGMEFIFPSDEPERYENREYKDHGILWRIPYLLHKDIHTKSIIAKSVEDNSNWGICVTYSIQLQENTMEFHIKIRNNSNDALPNIARLHPCFRLTDKTELEIYDKEILWEGKQAKYCSFKPTVSHYARDSIISDQGTIFLPNRISTWNEHSVFFHIKQTRGAFFVKEEARNITVQYDHTLLPYLTICSFMQGKDRIGIMEPANVAGACLAEAQNHTSIPELEPGEEDDYQFFITLQ